MIDIKFQNPNNEVRFFTFANYIDDMIGQDKNSKILNYTDKVFSLGSYLDYALHC